MSVHDFEMYTFVIPSSIVFVSYLMLMIWRVTTLCKHHPDDTSQVGFFEDNGQYPFNFDMCRSFIISTLVVIDIILSIAITTQTWSLNIQYSFCFSHLLLSIIWLLFYQKNLLQRIVTKIQSYWPPLETICKPFTAVQTFIKIVCPKRFDSNFKTFLKINYPQDKAEFAEAEEALERDKKYTANKKEELSYMLGTSSTSSDGVSKASTAVAKSVKSDLSQNEISSCSQYPKYQDETYVYTGERPLKGRAFIVDDSQNQNQNVFKRSHSMPATAQEHNRKAHCRKSAPNPFPELKLEKSICYIKEEDLNGATGDRNSDEKTHVEVYVSRKGKRTAHLSRKSSSSGRHLSTSSSASHTSSRRHNSITSSDDCNARHTSISLGEGHLGFNRQSSVRSHYRQPSIKRQHSTSSYEGKTNKSSFVGQHNPYTKKDDSHTNYYQNTVQRVRRKPKVKLRQGDSVSSSETKPFVVPTGQDPSISVCPLPFVVPTAQDPYKSVCRLQGFNLFDLESIHIGKTREDKHSTSSSSHSEDREGLMLNDDYLDMSAF